MHVFPYLSVSKTHHMKKLLFTALLVGFVAYAQQPMPTIGSIETYDPEFTKLLLPDAKIEVLAIGFIWSEGPVWVKDGGYLLFSDAPQNTIFRWDDKEGIKPFLKPSGYTGLGRYSDEPGSNGLLINTNGELVACEHGDRRISKMNLMQGGKVTLADKWKASALAALTIFASTVTELTILQILRMGCRVGKAILQTVSKKPKGFTALHPMVPCTR